MLTTIYTVLNFTGTAVTCLPNYGSVLGTSTPDLNSLPLCGVLNTSGCSYFWNVSGNIFYDANANCYYSAPDTEQGNVKVQLYSNGTLIQQTFSGSDGGYSFQLPDGDYTIQLDSTSTPFTILCPALGYDSAGISVSDSLSYNNNFSLICPATGFDVGVHSILWGYNMPRPGAHFAINAIAGDITELYGAHCASGISGQVQMVYSGPLSYSGPAAGALTPTTVSGDTLTWNINDYGTVADQTAFNMLFNIQTYAVPGSLICFTVNVTPVAGDNNPSNNNLTYCFPVVDALDPNEKEVYPTTVDTSGWLTYTIRFQNTGSAPAFNILVSDTLDPGLDPSTFQLLAYSAKNVTQVTGNVVDFNFPGINLPDSAAAGDSASRGFVQYRIKLISGLAAGTNILNTANIYFDLNSAVVTNIAVSTVELPTAIAPLTANELSVKIYPNPASDILYIQTQNIQPQTLSIHDVNGQLVSTMRFVPQVDVSNLAPGVYLIEVSAPEGVARRRFVKM